MEALLALTRPTVYFIGVTTKQSSIMNVFPRWSDMLGLGVQIVGYDAPILRSPSVSRIRYVSDTDTAGIRLGYVSDDFYYFRILLCIGYAYRYVWAALDTAQHNFWPI